MPTTINQPPNVPLRGAPNVPEVFETIGEDFLDRGEAARAFGISPYTLTYWRTWKGLPYVRFAGAKRDGIAFRVSKLRAWAEKHGVPFNPPVK